MNANDSQTQEHVRLWMKGLYRALIKSELSTTEVNLIIQQHSRLLKEQS